MKLHKWIAGSALVALTMTFGTGAEARKDKDCTARDWNSSRSSWRNDDWSNSDWRNIDWRNNTRWSRNWDDDDDDRWRENRRGPRRSFRSSDKSNNGRHLGWSKNKRRGHGRALGRRDR